MTPYLQLLYGAAVMVSFWAVFRSLIYNMHMFQLNGYRASTHFAWLGKNLRHYLMDLAVLALAFTGLIPQGNDKLMAFGAAALLLGVCGLVASNRAKKRKSRWCIPPASSGCWSRPLCSTLWGSAEISR